MKQLTDSLLCLFVLLCTCVPAPTLSPALRAQVATPAADRAAAWEQRRALRENSPAAGLELVNIGPNIMSGRVVDMAVDPQDPTHFYVGYASGGLWETRDNGITFRPLFDDQAVMTIGAVAVHWPSGTLYVGTGEVNSSRSSYAGNGLYRSTDNGQHWTHLGLAETHHIGRVIVDEQNPDIVWVAALGHLYGTNPERGVYKTTDGGQRWQKTLFVDEQTGAVDLIRDPRQPNELFAATWQRQRWAWDFRESGPGSGVWHSTDGGVNWQRITTTQRGFPTGAGGGRIGLALSYAADGTRHLLASIDNYFRKSPDELDDPGDALTKNDLRKMKKAAFLATDDLLINDFLRSNGFPRALDAQAIRQKVAADELSPQQLVEYLEDANSLLFETPVKGFELYRSTDDGQSWTRTHEAYVPTLYNTYGYYFGQIVTLPDDPQTIYALGVPIIKSTDGGATWQGINGDNVHADHHFLWINPDRPGHLINGNDGGVNISYDGGENWQKCNYPPVGQFYDVALDNHPDGYRVYGGLQDNGTWRGPHDYEASTAWRQTGAYPYKMLFGGDGMQTCIDPRDQETVYVGFQYGNYFRLNPKEGTRKFLTPKHELGQRPYRWNWETPILLSPHQPDIFYMGSNHVHRSFNRGDDFTTISPDLTRGGKKGDVSYGTLTNIDESPLQFGLLYTGSDDGAIYRSQDGGANWEALGKDLPQDRWVSRIVASKHDRDVVYLSLNGYRNDDFSPYVYRSEDRGTTWTDISSNLPTEAINVIYEDPASRNLLYVGTDHGLYLSLDRGANWVAMANGLPAVAVHDVEVHPTARELIVATHGRSLYRADVSLLQQAATAEPVLTLVAPDDWRYSERYGSPDFNLKPIEPDTPFKVYHPGAAAGATLRIKSGAGQTLYRRDLRLQPGVNVLPYDMRCTESAAADLARFLNEQRKPEQKPLTLTAAKNGVFYLRPGDYTAEITVGETRAEAKFTVQ